MILGPSESLIALSGAARGTTLQRFSHTTLYSSYTHESPHARSVHQPQTLDLKAIKRKTLSLGYRRSH